MVVEKQGIVTVDSGHNEANLRRVCGTGEVGVDLFLFLLIERHEAVQDVFTGRWIIRTTC